MISFDECFQQLPLVAILRGIKPAEAVATVDCLIKAGFRLIEIPLNSPDALTSIKLVAEQFGDIAMIGAGTVLESEHVRQVLEAKGRLIVSPNVYDAVGEKAVAREASWVPGITSPTEAFAALRVGAQALKIFPAEMVPPSAVKAMCAVLPKGTRLLPVGGITPSSMSDYVQAGASGFGLGSALYAEGDSPSETAKKAEAFVLAAKGLFEIKS